VSIRGQPRRFTSFFIATPDEQEIVPTAYVHACGGRGAKPTWTGLRERGRLKQAKTVNRALLDSKKTDVNDCSMKGHLLFLATVLGLGALIFLAGCAENSGWDTGFMGAPMNSNATPSDSYR
jgi:hypothetical protein